VVLLLWFGTKYFGLVGAISSVVIVSLAERVITVIRFSRILGAQWSDLTELADVAKLALIAAAAALVTAVVRTQILSYKPFFILAICGVVFGCIYVAGVLLWGIPTADEKRLVLNRLRPFVPQSLRPRLP